MNWKNYKEEIRHMKEAKGQRRSKDGHYDEIKATRRDVLCLSVTHTQIRGSKLNFYNAGTDV